MQMLLTKRYLKRKMMIAFSIERYRQSSPWSCSMPSRQPPSFNSLENGGQGSRQFDSDDDGNISADMVSVVDTAEIVKQSG